MKRVWQGAALGLGLGLAIALVESWIAVLQLVVLGLPAMTRAALISGAIPLVFFAVAGVLACPLLSLPRGRLLQPLACALAWTTLGLLSTPWSGLLTPLLLSATALAVALLFAAREWARRYPRLATLPALGAVVAIVFVLALSVGRDALARPKGSDLATRIAAAPGAPDVVIVVLDTVRARNLSAYGYERETSPVFDDLARGGALFSSATSPGNWSLSSHASLFTGVFPSVHGAHAEYRRLDDELPTLAGVLAAAGYESVCFTANPWISDTTGLTRGFDWMGASWRDADRGQAFSAPLRIANYLTGWGVDDKGGGVVAARFRDWLDRRPSDARPFFAFLNFVEAHFPYHELPEEYLRSWAKDEPAALRDLSMQLFADQFGPSSLDRATAARLARDMYDGGVRYSDALLGEVVAALRERGSLDDSIFVVLADHGELLGEHDDFGHGRSLFEEETHVPLLVRYPAFVPPGARVDAVVSTLGVMATVLELAGAAPPSGALAGSLLPVLAGRPAGLPAIAERFVSVGPGGTNASGARLRTYRVGDHKLIEASEGEPMLFDLARDPGEARDLATAEPELLARMEAELVSWRRLLGLPDIDAPPGSRAAVPAFDPAAEDRLRALGYIE